MITLTIIPPSSYTSSSTSHHSPYPLPPSSLSRGFHDFATSHSLLPVQTVLNLNGFDTVAIHKRERGAITEQVQNRTCLNGEFSIGVCNPCDSAVGSVMGEFDGSMVDRKRTLRTMGKRSCSTRSKYRFGKRKW